MFLSGYHGTSLSNANNIVLENQYNISNGKKEWLGPGIYFYFDINDAYEWRNSEAIMHSVIRIEENEFLDIDTEIGSSIFNQIIDHIALRQKKSVNKSVKKSQKNQCAVMKMIWDSNPNIKAIAASFPSTPTKVRTLLDRRHVRKEFCVRNNDSIVFTYIIRKDEING